MDSINSEVGTQDSIVTPNIQTVMMHAAMIKQQVSAMGANDSEFSDIDNIVRSVQEGTLEATEALLALNGVKDSKQDYH